MKYEGGSLPLEQGKTQVTISESKVVFTQGQHKLAIPLQNITMISCNTDVRRRFGASVLGAVPKLHLDTAETHYVGLTWIGESHEGQPPARLEGVFKLSTGDYTDFLTTLERLTGQKAVDTHRVPTVVRYGI
ncbi:MAG TPA: hypothetical protein VGF16_17700 [Bryobacteraceae bacterium]|jgi:hypothetical protein